MKRSALLFAAGVAVLALAVLAIGSWVAPGLTKRVGDGVREAEGIYAGIDPYVFGFPLVVMDLTRQVMTATPTAGELAAPVNQFQRLPHVVPWNFNNVVRISTNSLWSTAFLDLAAEPVVLTIPDTGRYPIAMRVMNMWTDVFGTAGTRTPDINAGNYLIAGPGWNGTVPADVRKVFRSTTRHAWVLVEQSASGPDQFPMIRPLQNALALTPLSAWGRPYAPPAPVPVDAAVDLSATPYDQVRLMTGEKFFERLAVLLKDNPAYPADAGMLEKLRKIGIEPGQPFDASRLHPGFRAGLNDVPALVWAKFGIGPYGMPAPNGWITMRDLGRYGTDYQTRAYVAFMGLGAGLIEDVVYPCAFVDSEGRALDGAYRYTIHFGRSELPASGTGVWSISAYRENFYVWNALERYGLLPHMPTFNADGSLDIYLQATSPGVDREANWLPIPPSGKFNLTMRIYNPAHEALQPGYRIPAVRRVN